MNNGNNLGDKKYIDVGNDEIYTGNDINVNNKYSKFLIIGVVILNV